MKRLLWMILLPLTSLMMLAQNEEDYETRLNMLQQRTDSLENRLQQIEDENQYQKLWGKKKHVSIGYVWGNLKNVDADEKFNGDFGFMLAWGRTFYFHKQPIAGMLKIGFDWDWLNADYCKYKERKEEMYTPEFYGREQDADKDFSFGINSIDVGMAFGPSFTVNPVGKMKAKVFFHVVPSYAGLIVDSELYSAYKTTFTYGGELTWGNVGLGIKGYTGSTKYKNLVNDLAEKGGYNGVISTDEKTKFRTSGLALYLTFKR